MEMFVPPKSAAAHRNPFSSRVPTSIKSHQTPFTARGQPPATARRFSTTVLGTSAPSDASARPITAAKPAGFVSIKSTVEKTEESGTEIIVREAEGKIYQLVHESSGNPETGLARAKEACKREQALVKQRESLGMMDQHNLDLSYCVLVNLAHQYYRRNMLTESINTYLQVVRNKAYALGGRLRVNIGHLYFKQKKYLAAIKMYRMAMDQISPTNRDIRAKIQKNIGHTYSACCRFQDAAAAFETVLEMHPTCHSTLYNLILCYYAIGEKDKLKSLFLRLIAIPMPQFEADDVCQQDTLHKYAIKRQAEIARMIVLGSKLIAASAPASDKDTSTAFDWIIEQIRASPCSSVAPEVEIAKSSHFLYKRNYTCAIESLRAFECRDNSSSTPLALSTAATNLSFLYFHESKISEATEYAKKSIQLDRYNARGHCNLGNCFFITGDYERARDVYAEAISIDSLCLEAVYNLGLCLKKKGLFQDALRAFEKLHSMLRNFPEVLWHIADLHERLGNTNHACEFFTMLISISPTDSKVLAKLGDLYQREGDKSQAFHYYSESYRFYPSDIDIIVWLGAHYLSCEVFEQSLDFFERACEIEPKEIKWHLMCATCMRRCGNFQGALDLYKQINSKWPNSAECLRYIVRIASDIGSKDLDKWQSKLSLIDKNSPKSSMSLFEIKHDEDFACLLP